MEVAGRPGQGLEPRRGVIVKRVRDGAGLVYVSYDAKGAVTPMVVVSQFGKGRVVCLNYNPVWFRSRGNMFTPFEHYRPFAREKVPDCDQSWPRYRWREYAYALLARCVLWAARREPDVQARNAVIELADDDQGALKMLVKSRNARGGLRADLLVRDGWSRLVSRQTREIAVKPGTQTISVPFDASALTGGLNFVDFRLLNDRGIVEFGAAAIERPAPKLDVTLTKDPVYVGETTEAVITLDGKLPDGARAVLSVADHHRRVLYERPILLDKPKTTAPLDLTRLETPGFWATVTIVRQGRVLARKDYRGLKQIPVVFDDWPLGIETYTGTSASWRDAYYETFRKNGFRLAHTSFRYGHGVASMRNSGLQAGDLKWLARHPSPNDPAYRRKAVKRIKFYAPLIRAYGIWDHTIIDELSVTLFSSAFDFSFDKYTLKKFREWAKTQYKDLAELNAAYGMSFRTWDEVRPTTFAEARDKGKYAGWADHRRVMELSLVDYFEFIRAELRKIDPTAKISLSGTQLPHSYNGHDVWLRCKTFDGLWSYT